MPKIETPSLSAHTCPVSDDNVLSDQPSLAAELDSLLVESEDNLANLERGQFELLLMHALREVVADYACVLGSAYQPQYRVDDVSIVGFEALLRWHPTDISAPDTQTLVDNLEDSGLINEVGQWVLESACQ